MMKLHTRILAIVLFSGALLNTTMAQERKELSGYVYSASDYMPLEGIRVSSKFRTVKSVNTDEEGKFTFRITDTTSNNTFMLSFAYPGYVTKEMYGVVGETIKVYLTPEGEYSIDGEVYYPYQNIKYSNSSTALEAIDFSYGTQIMSNSVEQLLENSTVNVVSASGAPGEGRVLTIRGYSTIFADEKPLIVLDGQVLGNYRFSETTMEGFYQDPLINIDPRNVESISVLKDAPAAVIYGAKASNGVIVIKTKSAKVGETEFDVTGHYGVNFMNDRLPVITNSEYFKPYLLEQMYGNGRFIYDDYFVEDPSFVDYYQYNNVTDWQNYIYEPGTTAGANINVRGGDAIAKYFLSGGYIREEGSVSNTSYNRFNVRVNADINMTEWLTAQANMGITYSNGQMREQGLSYANPMVNALIKAPFLDPFLIDSTNTRLPLTADSDVLGISNPYEVINNSQLDLSSYNFFGTVNFNIKISDDLYGNVRASQESNKLNEFVFLPDHGFYNNDYPIYNQVKKGISSFSRTSVEFNLHYDKNFAEVHNVRGVAGMRMNSDEIIQDIGTGVGTPSDEFKDLGTTRPEGRTKSGYQFLRSEITNFLNVDYNYKEEYFATLSLALDASSNVGYDLSPQILGVPMALSPALGLGWNLSKRMGLSNDTRINYLKARLSAGQIANMVYDPYFSNNFYVPSQYYTAAGIAKPKLENTSLRWERTLKTDLGADVALMKSKLFVSLDVYYHQTMGLLNSTSGELELGNQYWNNDGNLNTMGSELRLRYKVIETPDLKWTTELSLAQYMTTVSGLDNDLIFDFGAGQKIFRNGQRAGSFYGYEVMGVIASDEQASQLNLKHANGSDFKAGDIWFNDRFEDGIIDDRDKTIIGNSSPDVYGSWSNRVSFKYFSIQADVSFTAGGEIYNHTRRILESMSGFENQSTATLRRWQVDGQETDIPTAAWGDPMGNSRFSTRWIESGSYLRLKRLTVSVNLNRWLKSTNTSEFYISGINLFTLDKYLGYDPEFAYGSSILWEGIDYMKFPQNRSIMAGVKFGL